MSDPREPGSYRSALETAHKYSLPGLAVDPGDRCVRAVNGTFEKVFGWSDAELEGVDYREIVEPDDHASVHALMSALSSGEAPSTQTIRLRNIRGDPRETRWVGIPIPEDEAGGTLVVFCWPTSWGEDSIPDTVEGFHAPEEAAWIEQTLAIVHERRSSQSSRS